jgi:hypothetical protein
MSKFKEITKEGKIEKLAETEELNFALWQSTIAK